MRCVASTVALVSLAACATTQAPSATDRAREILARPERTQEEKAAWYPKSTEPLQALLAPTRKLKDVEVQVREIDVPSRHDVGLVTWMDKRYAMVGLQDLSAGPDKSNHRVAVVDTITRQVHAYRDGRFACYRDGRIVVNSGPNLAHIRPDLPGGFMWAGEVLHEKAGSPWTAPKTGTPRRFVVSQDTCTPQDPAQLEQVDKAIGGVFFPEPRKEETPIWKRVGLLPEHGFFSYHLPTIQAIPYGPLRDAYAELFWFRPDGSKMQLKLSHFHEVGTAGLQEWAPWLGVYAFTGVGVRYSRAPARVDATWTEAATAYGVEGNVVLFNPGDGTITRTPRPASLLDTVQIEKAYATRAGLLWRSAYQKPWGLYLSQGQEVKRISDRHAVRIAMSPDGCRALVVSNQRPQHAHANRLELFDFCGGV